MRLQKERQQLCPTSIADPNKRLVKKRVRKKPLQPVRTKDKQRPFPPRPSNPVLVTQVPNLTSYNSLLVNEAIKLLTSKGLHSGYIEYLRSNTDESIKRSFEKVKKELVNKQSFLGTATSVERYLQAARILYNRLDWKKRRQYEYAARNRVRLQHLSNLTEKRDSLGHDVPLFINDPDNFTHGGLLLYEAFLSRRIHCPLCPVSAEKLANAVQYQLHMLERHSCAHLYACHFCGMVFPSLEALKIHDNCAEFAATFFQNDDSSDEIQGGVPSCGPNLCVDSSGLIYGGVSSAIFRTKFWKDAVDPWESVTVRKKLNRLKRKLSGPDCRVDQDEIDDEDFINDKIFNKEVDFDFGADLKTNGYFYTAVNSKEETVICEERSQFVYEDELAVDCGSWDFILTYQLDFMEMENRCSILSVLCVFAGNGIPNSRIKCWECSSTVCSIFGLRVHMTIYHGIFLKTEEVSNNAEILKCIPKFTNSTTRAINTSIGLTPDGCLPVNLEEKKKDALVAKLRLDQGAPPSTSSQTSTTSSLASSKTKNPEAEVEAPPIIILNADSSPLEQMSDCPEPLSVQVIDHVGQTSPIEVTTLHDVSTTCAQGEITSSRMTPQGFSYKEVDIDEIDGFVHSTHGKYHQANSSSSLFDALFREEESVPINSDPIHDEPTVNEPLLCTSSYEQSLVCEFCCLTLRSYTALKEHWKLHIEIPITCYLCDPPLLLLQTAETFLEHIHAAHTSRLDSYKQHKYIYTKCNFCAFRIRRERVVAHLLSECYMAPCILCGAKLFRRSERTGHWKSHSGVMHRFLCECRRGFATFNAFSEHLCRNKSVNIVTCDTCNAKFSGQGNGRSKALTACVDHYMESHTFNLCCLSCKTEPLETLREHVLLIHVKESTEVVTPKPTLLRCSQIELFNNTFQDYLTPSVSKEKRKEGSDCRQFGNEAGMVREERVETPNIIPRSSVMDDGEDGILIVDDMSKHSSSSSSVAPIVHTVNEGDDECMMLDVIELPTGVVSHAVAATREKKYKCSMCSQTFLRKSTCRYHEQNSHRNDIISDLCNEVYGVPLDEDSLLYICQQCAVAFEDPQRARRHISLVKCAAVSVSHSPISMNIGRNTRAENYHIEAAIYYHLHVDHGVPIIAFCKNCLVGSANMDRIFGHVMYRECSGGKWSNPHISVPTLLRSLGFAVASDLYFQPKDEVQHRKAETVKVNQNRWHSYLCATNREAPGEMPSVLPETVVKKVRSENLIDMLYSRFKASAMNCQRFADLCIGM
uniref:C2H2-type domain-containing protein n=1 Tax=Angiostrongylus cantonensis TaxID=6313 RepID=A0A158P8R9_ANGCA